MNSPLSEPANAAAPLGRPDPIVDRHLRVRGIVQGVGFRPFVSRLAAELNLRGSVRNDAEGVLIRALGPADQIDALAERLQHTAPASAHVTGIEWLPMVTAAAAPPAAFTIEESSAANDVITTDVPVDLAPCADCRAELFETGDRREGYPFTNCTQCGPRYSIIEQLPYDRARTSMRTFKMCPECEREYRAPSNRRYHAEPNACPACGPALRLTDSAGATLASHDRALAAAAKALSRGWIVAVKGVGGFHLVVDALNEPAVAKLRQRKHRDEKPFAVMFADLEMLRAYADLSPEAAARLGSAAAPIVLLAARGRPLAPGIAPGNPWIGALLPPSPVHLLLLQRCSRPLVATSGNVADEPLCIDDDEARARLRGIADLFLGHDRAIVRPVDDSVLRLRSGGGPIVLRRARGFSPVTFALPDALPEPLLCVGAQMKSTVAVAVDRRLVLSPHIGDLGTVPAQDAFARTIDALTGLLRAPVAAIVSDKHPDYASTRYALGRGLRRIEVQHHLAHVLAVLLEHRQQPHDVLGVAWDGTGYGEDGTVWGGEFILLRHGIATRVARLRPFSLPGGEAAVREPRRVALALASALPDATDAGLCARLGYNEASAATLRTMIAHGLNSPLCSSVGRLFDGVGALLGLGVHNAFEGQTALRVEIAALRASAGAPPLPFALTEATDEVRWEVDWRPAVDALLRNNVSDPATNAACFHAGLVTALAEIARRVGVETVVLSGGCFQNVRLTELAEDALRAAGHRVLTARELPPNDGAIAAGQALGALWHLTTVEPTGSASGPAPAEPGPA